MSHLLYLMFRFDFDVIENLKNLESGELNTVRIRLAAGCAVFVRERRRRGREK